MAEHTPGKPRMMPGAADTQGAESAFLESVSPTASLGHAGMLDSLSMAGGLPRVRLREPATKPSADASSNPAGVPDTLPASTGRYMLLGEIARGGMGAILRGRDNDLGRDIAFKVLLESRENDPQVVRRFLEEAQIAGQLQHPGVVPVYELGQFTDRRPYFTMKLVQGQTLARLLADRTDLGQDLPRWLGVFQQVCQTVAFAHSRGVIHRDLKPHNVMVGEFGEVQVMDWGLAKVLTSGGPGATSVGTETMVPQGPLPAGSGTQAGAVLGTPAYMAPEQARGEVAHLDERCDVFGLGAILCEILTDRPPFSEPENWRILMLAAEGKLDDAFARLDCCGADADLVQLAKRCLAANPDERPRNAGVVADVVTAYLAGVQERLRAAEVERATAEAKAAAERRTRRRTVALALSLVGTVLLASFGWLGIERARDARQETTAREINDVLATVDLLREQARKAPAYDVQPWIDALAAVEKAQGMLATGETDTATRERVERLRRELDEEKAEADRDRAMLTRLEGILLDRFVERGSEVQLQPIHDAYIAAFRDYGFDILKLPAEEAITRLRASRISRELATAVDAWAHHFPRMPSDPDDAGWKQIVAVARKANDDPWREELYRAIQNKDGDALIALAGKADVARMPPADVLVIAGVLLTRGVALHLPREVEAGVAFLHRGREQYPHDFALNLQLSWASGLLQPVRYDEQLRHATAAVALRPGNALAYLNQAVALAGLKRCDEALKSLDVAQKINPDTADTHGVRAIILREKKDPEGAIASLGKAIKASPDYVPFHVDLGTIHLGQGRPSEALACYDRALAIDSKRALLHVQRGRALEKLNRDEDALACYRRALEIDPKLAPAHGDLTDALVRLGRIPEARAAFEEGIKQTPDDLHLRVHLGLLLRGSGKEDAAIEQFDHALRIAPTSYEALFNKAQAQASKDSHVAALATYRRGVQVDPNRPECHYGVGMCCDLLGEPENAIAAFREAHRLNPKDARTLDRLGGVLYRKRAFTEAIPVLQKALAIDDRRAAAHFHLGDSYRATGQFAQAVGPLRRAIDLDPANRVDARINLAFVYNKLGKVDDTLAVLQEAVEQHPDHAHVRCNLAVVLRGKGRFRDALAHLERAEELAKRQPGQRLPIAQEIQECRQLLIVERNLPAVLSGDMPLQRAEDMIIYARFCKTYRQLYVASAGLYEKAFALTPELAERWAAGHRFDAACAAALAGGGKGEDGAKLQEGDRARWRRKAVAWLREDLRAITREAETITMPARARQLEQFLQLWETSPSLVGLRDPAAVQKLPEPEREPCKQLWADVAALVARLRRVQ